MVTACQWSYSIRQPRSWLMARCAEWSHRILRHTLCSVLADSLFFLHNTETYHVSISKNNFPRVGKPVGRWYFGTGDTTQILKIQGNTSQWDKMVKTWFDHIHSNLICPGLISVCIYNIYIMYNRRKFRSQTSDNMDR